MKFINKNIEYLVSFPTMGGETTREQAVINAERYSQSFPGHRPEGRVVMCHIRQVVAGEVELVSVTRAECSVKDTYIKTVGEKIALARGLENLGFSKEERSEIWEQYFLSSRKRLKIIVGKEGLEYLDSVNTLVD